MAELEQIDLNKFHRQTPKLITSVPQKPTSFPNENELHIDYVITFKDNKITKKVAFKNAVREEFFQKFTQEGLLLKFIEFTNNNANHTYVLVHCPDSRLMIEAENIGLRKSINNVIFCKLILGLKCCKKSF